MTLDDLKEQWAKDCVIDEQNVDRASAISPNLHSKYLNELISAKLKLTKTQLELAQLKANKAKYFRGEMTKEELEERGWQQWQYRTLKSDIEGMLEADSDIQTQIAREGYMKAMVLFIESVMGEIKTRSFHCKNIIDYQKFRAGA